MFLVPLPGDVITTLGGVQRTVLSYSAYRSNPVLYVENAESQKPPESVLFDDVQKINGTPVTLHSGKIFVANSLVKRKLHLPQINDKVVFQGHISKVKSVKLFERGNIASGIQILGQDINTNDKTTDRLLSVQRIERADGTESTLAFSKIYKDYVGAK